MKLLLIAVNIVVAVCGGASWVVYKISPKLWEKLTERLEIDDEN